MSNLHVMTWYMQKLIQDGILSLKKKQRSNENSCLFVLINGLFLALLKMPLCIDENILVIKKSFNYV